MSHSDHVDALSIGKAVLHSRATGFRTPRCRCELLITSPINALRLAPEFEGLVRSAARRKCAARSICPSHRSFIASSRWDSLASRFRKKPLRQDCGRHVTSGSASGLPFLSFLSLSCAIISLRLEHCTLKSTDYKRTNKHIPQRSNAVVGNDILLE